METVGIIAMFLIGFFLTDLVFALVRRSNRDKSASPQTKDETR